MARPLVVYGGGLADLTQGQLAGNAQADAAASDFRNYLAHLDEIAQRRDAASGQERVGMDANATSRYNTDSSGSTSRYNTDAVAGTSRYGIDAKTSADLLNNQFNRYALAQQSAEAEKNRLNQLAMLHAQGDEAIRVGAAQAQNNPFFGNPKMGQDYFDLLSQIDQGNQDDTAITGQANAELPTIIKDASTRWFNPTGDSATTFREAMGNTTNATPDQAVLRSTVLSKAMAMPGAINPTTGVPRFSLPPTATNFVPVLRTAPSIGRRAPVALTPVVGALKPLTPEIALQYLTKANNDKNLARQAATSDGYSLTQ